jgi:hypothetical protein
MRKFFFTLAKTIFLVVGISFYCHGQIAKTIADSTEREGKFKKNKLYRNQVNSRAIRDFVKRYSEVSNEKWTVTEAGITAGFVLGGIGHSICYDENGNWISTVRRYTEKHLQKTIRRWVKNAYSDYNIKGVEETEKSFNKIIYLVLLENEAGWLKVRVEEGALSVLERINK